MAFEIDMAHCAANEDRRMHAGAAELRAEAETAAQVITEAAAGDFSKLIYALDHKDNYDRAMGALFALSQRGVPEAVEVIQLLVATYAEHNTEVEA